MSTAIPTESSSQGQKPQKEDQLHSFHRYGDFSIRSTDAVVFKINSGRLAEVSTVFKDMMEVGTQKVSSGVIPQTLSNPDIVDVGFPSSTVETFFNMICTPNPRSIDVNYRASLVLYQLCEQFDIEGRFQKMVETCLVQRAKEHFQWDLLIWSADRNDIKMARNALSIMTAEDFLCPRLSDANNNDQKVHLDFWSAMGRLPLSWQNDLIHRCFTSPYRSDHRFSCYSNGGDHRMITCTEWERLAKDFNP